VEFTGCIPKMVQAGERN